MAKTLKRWNGRGQGSKYQNWHFNVAAYSKNQAAELIGKAGELNRSCLNEINVYYSPCWGLDMAGIEPTEPGVWATNRTTHITPIRII